MDTINSVLAKFEEPKSKPLNYIRKSALKSSNTQELLADVFKLMVCRSDRTNRRRNALLKEIFIQDFESEQIWQQIELRNKTVKTYIPGITKLLLNKSEVKFPYIKKADLVESSQVDNSKDDTITVENDETSSDESEDNVDDEEIPDKAANIEDMNDEDEEYTSDQADEAPEVKVERKASSKTGDMFFDLNEMESFLEKAENEEGGNDGIDYFTDMLSDEEEDSDQPMYNDFFEDPSSKKTLRNKKKNDDSDLSDENDEVEGEGNHFRKRLKRKPENSDKAEDSKKVRFMSDEDETDSDEDETKQKSSFEKKNSRLKEHIAKLEDKALSEKPWPQKGEVDSQGRPENSLLEEIVDVDLSTRPAPVMTEKVTLDLESIIIKRIKDRAFDDVERKIKPVHVQHELKKELVLNQEKSKLSLAQVYEQEFLSKQEVNNDQEPVESKEITQQKEEIIKMMKSVFKKLDTLSNFHYTPKPVIEELKIISNAPAISLEEAIPMAVAESSTLAPQEVSGKKRELMGKDERTKTDKRRERRKKKAFLSNKFKKSKNVGSLASKVLKSKKVSLVEPTNKDKAISTSTKFFTKLQENSEAGTLIKKPKEKPLKFKPHK
ncbi:unnamed protein product [Nezara viridula]|uniref:U3 small nucleolar ribonucleoprotein protein MPP10 n=1 Tax=Nezara viridula TaxID=85310 RepID=A0A9P0HRY2_NEZVI|nr:unnamed protein product [Nezara viridula]